MSTNTALFEKVYNFLRDSPLEHITAVSIVNQVIEEEPWFPKEDSRQLIYNAIASIKNLYGENSGKYKKLIEIPFKVSTEEIETNLQKLKLNLGNSTAPYAKKLLKYLKKIKPSDLSWRDPKASQVISSNSEIIRRLSEEAEDEYNHFMEPVKCMEGTTPLRIKDVCNGFVMSYNNTMYEGVPIELSHGNWDESEEDVVGIASGILNTIGSIWRNPAFGEKFTKSQNEGTYVTDIIVPVMKASLEKLPIKSFAFVSTIASKDRRGKTDKEENDWVKLWREMNDGMYWVHKGFTKMQSEFDLLKQWVIDLEVENAKLKQIIEANAKREAENINLKMELEKNKKDITYLSAENSELKIKVAKLSCDFKEIKSKGMITDSPDQLSISEKKIVSVSTEMENSSVTPEQIDIQTGDVLASDISDDTSNSDDIPTKEISPLNESQPDKEEAITPNPITGIEHSSTWIFDFVEMKHKEHVSKEIMERIREKKLRNQNSSLDSTSSEPFYENQNLESSIISQSISNSSELSSDNNSSCDSESKSPTNVERGLRLELSICTKDNNHKISNVIDIQIPEFSIEAILTESSEVTAENIADLFNIAMKTRQKEILCWYYYYKAYENRVRNIKIMDKIDDKSARTLVYNEIKSLLPDVTDVNLRKITFRAKRVYILFEGIGIDKISQVTYSASAISSLKDIQIQSIVNDFSKKLIDTNCQAQSAISSEIKAIGVTNCHAHMSDPSSSNDISDTKVNLSSVSIDLKIKTSEDTKKVLPETGINVLPSYTKTDVINPPVSRPPISILPDDPEEKRKSVINKVLEQFPYLSSKYSRTEGTTLGSKSHFSEIKGYKNHDYFDFNSSASCPICNKDHKKENIRDNIEGRWGSGDYVNTRTYRLQCREAYQNSIQIVTVKA
ncbi:9234_t:CDS:2 [Paraglomus brasilianum]|uniref:9234_t:CDS:1 n=1 Tax=Paraglomus brasilianum TaxID=144538 RepID=A0A9N9GRR2_9GLOM|nr:9234_t:CDS:2 [Paraglomus brasilianum]